MRANRALSPERRGTELLSLAALRKREIWRSPYGASNFPRKPCHPPVPAAPPPFPERRLRHFVMEHLRHNSRSRNVLASPLGEEGHEVAKGVQANWIHRGAPRPANPVRRHPARSVWTVVRMIMTLDMDVTAERRHYNTHRPAGNPQPSGPKGPSNLRTLRPSGRSILRTFFHNPLNLLNPGRFAAPIKK